MIRRATPQDAAALEAFLLRHAAGSMFLRSILERYGTQEMVHRDGAAFFVKQGQSGIEAVAAVTNGGYLMCQAPDQSVAFWEDMTARLRGRSIAGITAVPDQAQAWMQALNIDAKDIIINKVEPLFKVMLEGVMPVESGLMLRPPQEADRAMLARWFDGYHADTGLEPAGGTGGVGAAKDFLSQPDARILMARGKAVAMCSINAWDVDTVQVVGVYVPTDQRGRGYGGAVVALHLAELAKTRIARAILFASSDFAARAYEAIGFRQVAAYRVAVLKTPMVVGDVPGAMSLGER